MGKIGGIINWGHTAPFFLRRTEMIKLTQNEVRLLIECAREGIPILPNGKRPKPRDMLDLRNIRKILEMDISEITITVTGERVEGLNGKKWKIGHDYENDPMVPSNKKKLLEWQNDYRSTK